MIHGEELISYVSTWLRHIIDDILWYMIGDIETHIGDVMVHELMMIWYIARGTSWWYWYMVWYRVWYMVDAWYCISVRVRVTDWCDSESDRLMWQWEWKFDVIVTMIGWCISDSGSYRLISGSDSLSLHSHFREEGWGKERGGYLPFDQRWRKNGVLASFRLEFVN